MNFALPIAFASSLLAAPAGDLAWPVDGDLTNSTALARLLVLPRGPGNACDDYAALTTMTDLPRRYPALGVDLSTFESGTPAALERLSALAADPEIIGRLRVFAAGAKKGACQMLGASVGRPFPEAGHPASWAIMNYVPIMAHAAVAEQRARDLWAQARADEGRVLLEQLVIAGWHLMQDNTLIGNMVGIKLGAHAAQTLGELLVDAGERKAGLQWKAYAGLTQWRRYESYEGLIKPLFVGPNRCAPKTVAMLVAIADSAQLPRGARVEAMLQVAMAHLCDVAGPPSKRQRRALAGWRAHVDPVLAEAATRFAELLDLDRETRAAFVKIGNELAESLD